MCTMKLLAVWVPCWFHESEREDATRCRHNRPNQMYMFGPSKAKMSLCVQRTQVIENSLLRRKKNRGISAHTSQHPSSNYNTACCLRTCHPPSLPLSLSRSLFLSLQLFLSVLTQTKHVPYKTMFRIGDVLSPIAE